MYVTDKVWDLVKALHYALNCILMMFPKPDVFPKKVVETRVKPFISMFIL